MRILLAHNRYQQKGGEDAVYEAEKQLLIGAGHEVVTFERDNHEIAPHFLGRAGAAASSVWSLSSSRELDAILASFRPEVAHFTNTFPLISPSAYYACAKRRVPVVQTVQNYRLICPSAVLFRDGAICEDCVGKSVPWPGVLHACYRGSRLGSATVAGMLAAHNRARTWHEKVDVLVAPTRFARDKLVQGGLPAERIAIKPNFLLEDPGARRSDGGFALFVGRLTEEKGIDTLLQAFRTLSSIPLKIAGTGPLAPPSLPSPPNVEWLGFRPTSEVLELMRTARLLVFPSRWYEGLPVTLVQALACGLPVVASRLGAMEEMITHGTSGRHFEPGSAEGLAREVAHLWDRPDELAHLSRGARKAYEAEYTATRNLELLLAIYERARG